MMAEMKIYHCSNAEENPIPMWMLAKPRKKEEPEKTETDIVAQFKQDPDAFFPGFMKTGH